jgi:glycosyltransferase involved in cell wall biosynthesis
VLSQTYPHIEVIVVGDAAKAATNEAIVALDDPRVTFYNLTLRGPYHEDPSRSWLASGTPGFNAGVALAAGLWIAPLGDDDAFVPEHVERLLTVALRDRLEFVYGLLRMILPDGTESLVGEFPPRLTQIGLQAALYHRGLAFMELELGHAIFGKPNDWGLVHRMMRTGVRMGMIDEVTVNYWPSLRAHPEHGGDDGSAPTPAKADEALQTVALEEQLSTLENRVTEESQRSEALDAQVLDLTRRLEEVRRSRSWRFTAPLRRLRSRV